MSGIVDLGDTYRYRFVVVNSATGVDVPTNPGSYTASITLPDGTSVGLTPANAGAGLYDVAYTSAQTGAHYLIGTATGGFLGSATEVTRDTFIIESADGQPWISQDEAIAHMRGKGLIDQNADDLEQLRWLRQVACDAVERDLGRVIGRRTITDYFDGGKDKIHLRKIPPRGSDGGAVTVTTVKENGTALVEGTDFFVTRLDWALIRGSRASQRYWQPGIEIVEATYVTSCNPIPATARKVALNGLQRMWQGSQQGGHRAYDELSGDQSVFEPSGVLTPLELNAYDNLRAVGGA